MSIGLSAGQFMARPKAISLFIETVSHALWHLREDTLFTGASTTAIGIPVNAAAMDLIAGSGVDCTF